jgi:trimeric autotransporter adhesin
VFRWNEIKPKPKDEQIGVIAQEVEQVFPQVVTTDSDGYKAVNYQGLVAPLIEAVKELKTINDQQSKRIDVLENKLNSNTAAHP